MFFYFPRGNSLWSCVETAVEFALQLLVPDQPWRNRHQPLARPDQRLRKQHVLRTVAVCLVGAWRVIGGQCSTRRLPLRNLSLLQLLVIFHWKIYKSTKCYTFIEEWVTCHHLIARCSGHFGTFRIDKRVFIALCFKFADSIGLHRVENKSHTAKAVSLHLYSPPFAMCQSFDERSGHRKKCNVTFYSKYGEKVCYVSVASYRPSLVQLFAGNAHRSLLLKAAAARSCCVVLRFCKPPTPVLNT